MLIKTNKLRQISYPPLFGCQQTVGGLLGTHLMPESWTLGLSGELRSDSVSE